MTAWYLDEGLTVFRRQWWGFHPGATVGTIADDVHSQDPDVTQHAPDRGTSGQPGDDKGEVDAADVMPGKGVTRADLAELFDELRQGRDPRLLFAIFEDRIFSSVVDPWALRAYRGAFHSHVHLSVNDKYDANTTVWRIGDDKVLPPRFTVTGKLAGLTLGMEDAAFDGYDGIKRVQVLTNAFERSLPTLDVDGVYGPVSARKVAKWLKIDSAKTLGLPELRKILGIYAS